MNICLCTKDDSHSYRIRKDFTSYKDLLEWTKEQIDEESKINIGDDVRIIDEDEMFTSLSTAFFTKVYCSTDDFINEEKMFDIIRYYRYKGFKYYTGMRGNVLAKYDNKYIVALPSDEYDHDFEYIVIGKEGVKKD